MSFVGNPEQFKAHLATLPKLGYHDDPDDHPGWVAHPRDVVGREPVKWDEGIVHSVRNHPDLRGAPLHPVPVENIRQTQQTLNLSAVQHYVHNGPNTSDRYDPDGWHGTDHPIIVDHPVHGPVLADGNSRFAASVIRGDKALHAHRVPYNPAKKD